MLGGDKLVDITKKRFKETEKRVGRKLVTPKLDKSNDEFFDKTGKYVKYHFVHDDLHDLMSHLDKPIYTYMQKDDTAAWCHESMWNEFSVEWKNYLLSRNSITFWITTLLFATLS